MRKFYQLKNAFRAAFPVTLPVFAGFTVLGIAYGILMSSKGYGPLWILLYSALAFGGSMQFVAITFMTGSFEPLQVFLLTIMVNARHLFYGLSMLGKYSGLEIYKFPTIFMMCDESFAINSSVEVPPHVEKKHFYFAVSFLDWLYWISAGIVGGLIGKLLTMEIKGLDFALTALFVVLFIEQLKSKRNAICGILGVTAAIISIFAFGSGNMVIPSMCMIFAALLFGRKFLCD